MKTKRKAKQMLYFWHLMFSLTVPEEIKPFLYWVSDPKFVFKSSE